MQDRMVNVVLNLKLESRIPAAAINPARKAERELMTGSIKPGNHSQQAEGEK